MLYLGADPLDDSLDAFNEARSHARPTTAFLMEYSLQLIYFDIFLAY
jgi:hypothetical protein